jgi:glucokinase
MKERAGYAIGLDVGGTKLAAGLVAMPSGQVLARRVIPTGARRGGEAVLQDAMALAETLGGESPAAVGAIGIAVAELVDPAGRVTSAHTIAWKGVPIQDHFAAIAPSLVESDVRAAALAEARFGAGRGRKLFVYVTVGTGISSCLVQDGEPFAGARGGALVVGSAPLTSVCPDCGATADIVLEEVASGPALVARYRQKVGRPVMRGEEVIAAAEAGEPAAVEVVRGAGAALGNSVAILVNVLDPEAVVVGGGLGQAAGLYWRSFVESTRRHIWAEAARDLPILPGQLGGDAGFIGAAARAWRRLQKL